MPLFNIVITKCSDGHVGNCECANDNYYHQRLHSETLAHKTHRKDYIERQIGDHLFIAYIDRSVPYTYPRNLSEEYGSTERRRRPPEY